MNLLNYYPREVGGGVISYPDLTLFYVGDLGTRLGEVYSVFQVTGMFESGQKSKPKKKNGQDINPQRIHAKNSEP